MTLYHFINCATLTFVPIFVAHKALLYDFGSWQQNLLLFCTYLVTQLFKLLIEGAMIAQDGSQNFRFYSELFRACVGLLDFAAIFHLLNRRQYKIAVGLNWAFAESLVKRLTPLIKDARGQEFNFANLQMAIESNISVAFYISISVLLSYHLRQSSSFFVPINYLLVFAASHQFLVKFLVNFFVILDSPSATGLFFSFFFVTWISFFTHRFGLLSSEKNK
eukprot:TRINITY_DN4967_c0_g1_i6.p1 TRINITY_DN4967_c0_g1~~TRINITY_DN4967_c0_g1_i6.p1  ORF type:complete len:220 (-),score=26.72 TRINITY_DN4967_c0_g1_i6:60-719(-)